jgi:hypothetical protein
LREQSGYKLNTPELVKIVEELGREHAPSLKWEDVVSSSFLFGPLILCIEWVVDGMFVHASRTRAG